MGIIARQSFKSSIVNYLGIAVGYLTVIWLFPKFLTPDEFGLTRVFLSLSVVLGEFGRLGLPFIVVRFFPFYKTEDREHYGFLRFILFLTTLGALVLTLFLLMGKELVLQMYSGPDAAFFERFYSFLIPITIGTVYAEVLFAYSRSLLRSVVPAFAKELLGRIVQLIAIGLFALGYLGFKQFLVVFAASILLQPLFVVGYLMAIREFRWNATFKQDGKAPVGGMIGYGLFMTLNKIPGIALNQLDMIMLGAMAGLEEAGIYAIAFFFAELVRVPTRNLAQIAIPIVADAWKRDDLPKINTIYKKSSLVLTTISSFILIMIIANFDVIRMVLQPGYRDVFWIVTLIGISKLIDSIAGINGGIVNTSKSYRFSMLSNSVLLILAIVTNFIFIPVYGILGAALATTISIFLMNVFSVSFVYFKYKLHPLNRHTVYVLLIGLMAFLVGVLIQEVYSLWLTFVVRSLAMVVVFWGGVYLSGLHKLFQSGTAKELLNSLRIFKSK